MGRKGGSTQYMPPPVQQPDIDINAMMAPMMHAMGAMMRMQASQPPPLPAMPELKLPEPIDWSTRQKELQEKIAKDTASDLARKRGRASTVLTSPLVEGEEVSSISATLSKA